MHQPYSAHIFHTKIDRKKNKTRIALNILVGVWTIEGRYAGRMVVATGW